MVELKSPWVKGAALVAAGVVGVYALIYADVVSRAKESYHQAEMYMDWTQHPEKKKAHFDKKFEAAKKISDQLLAKNKISQDDYQQKMEGLSFDRDFSISESSFKYAYQYYKDTVELFSPPESKWVVMARAKVPTTLELWKQELRAQNIPFEDTMFE